MSDRETDKPHASQLQAVAVIFVLAFPTILTWVYFVALADAPAVIQKLAYSIGKVIQFGFPIAWVLLHERWRPMRPKWSNAGVLFGVTFGLMIGALTLALYHGWWKPSGLFDTAAVEAQKKLAGMGLTRFWQFALLGSLYSVGHSFLEEYYWRWFVFSRLRQRVTTTTAVLVSSVGFMAHHIIVVAVYFGMTSWLTWFLSLGVAVGGAVWAKLYEQSRSLIGPWISHGLVDAAIFLVGYDLIKTLWAAP